MTSIRNMGIGTRKLGSSGRLLGPQLLPSPSHVSDLVTACVRFAHYGYAKECSPAAPPELPLQSASALPPFAWLLSFTPLLGASKDIADINSREQHKCVKGNSFASSYTDQEVEVVKRTDILVGEIEGAAETPCEWASFVSPGSEGMGAEASPPGAESSPTSPLEENINGTFSKESSEKILSQSHVLRLKLSGILSLVPSHSKQFMAEMPGTSSTSLTQRHSKADSKICSVAKKEYFSRMMNGLNMGSNISSVPCCGASGGYVGRYIDASDMGVRADSFWCEDKFKDGWNVDPWRFEQRNILIRTLHVMRCDSESLKSYIPTYIHPVMMNNSSSTVKQGPCKLADDDLHDVRENLLKGDKGLIQIVEKDHVPEPDKDVSVVEASQPENELRDQSASLWTHGYSKAKKQWWKELLAAFGLAVWLITGAVLAAKALGVPNLLVSQNVAYSGFWGRPEDDQTKSSNQGAQTEILELSSSNFDEVIMKRSTFVMFYAPWCPHCQHLHPVWKELASVLSREGCDVRLAIVDATKHARLADKYEVQGYPSLIMFKRGVPAGRHRGPRDISTLMSFINHKK